MRIIAVTNQKGGCGKTTTAINLAASLSTNGRKVLLIDLDPQSHATLGLNIKAPLSIYNVLSKIAHQKAKLENIVHSIGPDFDIAPSSIVLSTLEQELSGEIGRESRLCDILKNFKSNYDYILIDCPPNLGILTVNAIRASSEVIIPVEASRFALEGMGQLVSIIELISDRLNHSVSWRVLVTNFDSRLAHSFKMLERIKSNFSGKLFDTIVHVNVKLKEAQNSGSHIFNFDKYCRGAKDYYSLSREIITLETPGVAKPESQVKIEKIQREIRVATAQRLEKVMKETIHERIPSLTNTPSFEEVIFSIKAPDAKEVYVVGDFNGWKTDDSGKMNHDNGNWMKRFNLAGGKYRYRFVVDGAWVDDPANDRREKNPFGTMDSLIEIKEVEYAKKES